MAPTAALWQGSKMSPFRLLSCCICLAIPLAEAALAQPVEVPPATVADAPPPDAAQILPEAATPVADASPFRLWIENYRTAALTRGLKAEWLDAALAGAVYVPRVVGHDRAQPDDPGRRSSYADYLAGKLPSRIAPGRDAAAEYRAELQLAATTSGVPAEILLSIWGIETFYGRVTGRFDLPSALASLGFEGRRAALFTGELDALVRIVGEGRVPRDALRGSWAGAFGQPQFLPSSYLRHGQDGDGDGRIDIIGSVPDTLASIGRYLTANGWKAGEPWGFRAVLPAGFDRDGIAVTTPPAGCAKPLSRHSSPLPAAEWRRRGVIAINAGWPGDDVPMTLVEPDGPGAGAFLVSGNFRAIMAYNCSNYYALSVVLLGDAVQASVR